MTADKLRRALRLSGPPIRVRFRRRLPAVGGRQVHAASFLRKRLIVLDKELRRGPSELERILIHELFHFVWLRLGNPARRSWEELLLEEFQGRARGELGWSSEWRKRDLRHTDLGARTRRWREYACESFCDTAAWLFAGTHRHGEFTLARRRRQARQEWFLGLARAVELCLPI